VTQIKPKAWEGEWAFWGGRGTIKTARNTALLGNASKTDLFLGKKKRRKYRGSG